MRLIKYVHLPGPRKSTMRPLAVLIGLLVCLSSLAAVESVPASIPYQGRLKDGAGVHVTGTVAMTVALYDTEAAVTPRWSEMHAAVAVVGGLFQIALGSVTPLNDTTLVGARWLGVAVDGAPQLARIRLDSAPFARLAGRALTVAAGSVGRAQLGGDVVAELDGLASQLGAQASRLAALEAKLASLSVSGTTVRFTGVNLQVVDGSGMTYGTPNGKGNLIIGYDEPRSTGSSKIGSHTLVIGAEHNYTKTGGLVAGFRNETAGIAATVSGGQNNYSSGDYSSVSGGASNSASGVASSVSGGQTGNSSGDSSSLSGGLGNTARGDFSSVSGGLQNIAIGVQSSVSGGDKNNATGHLSSVSGGLNNNASGLRSSVSGGFLNTASGAMSGVGGGNGRIASPIYSWTAGTLPTP